MRRGLGLIGIILLSATLMSCGSGCKIQCNDGTCSNAKNTQGACSHHGGIASEQSSFGSPTAPSIPVPR